MLSGHQLLNAVVDCGFIPGCLWWLQEMGCITQRPNCGGVKNLGSQVKPICPLPYICPLANLSDPVIEDMDDDYVFVSHCEEGASDAQSANVSLLEYLPLIDSIVDDLEATLWPLNCFIHEHPELGYEEYKAHDALTAFMQKQPGWSVTRAAYSMDTAWEAVFETGRAGPTIAFNAEMGRLSGSSTEHIAYINLDALPGLGHACGHNLIAVVSVAAALATAQVLDVNSLPGTVILIGTPAEEGGGGKIKCLEAGAYDDVDVSLISHPGILNNSPMVRTTAFTRVAATYHGKKAHSAKNPWEGINALDAMVTAYNSISCMRQQTRADDFVGVQITNGGSRPNFIHESAAGVAVLRAATAPHLKDLQNKVEGCFRAGAEATGADVEIKVTPGYLDHMPNRVLADSFTAYWTAMPDLPDPPLPPPGQYTWVKSSTDQGNLSYAMPSMNVSFAIPPGPQRGQPHSPDFEQASKTKPAFISAMRVAKAMAGTAIDVCTVPGLLHQVKEQWKKDVDS